MPNLTGAGPLPGTHLTCAWDSDREAFRFGTGDQATELSVHDQLYISAVSIDPVAQKADDGSVTLAYISGGLDDNQPDLAEAVVVRLDAAHKFMSQTTSGPVGQEEATAIVEALGGIRRA